ncbi:MAG: molybdopterin dehydrogenase FAD-binding protein [Marmoricola sp.]|nr:molybdopterin dehydrogenase FAD-binding protein [Marmoricola sp.]
MRAFTYLTPSAPTEVVEMLDAHAPDARVIAGGQNLLLGMKDRSDSPAFLVSLGGVSELEGVRAADSGELVIGAATTYATLARMEFTGWHAEIASVCGNLADRPVRTMGTIGGAACAADPRYDIPALVTGVGASLEVLSAQGVRTIEPSDFFLEGGGTSLQPGDLLTAVRFPATEAFTTVVFEKFRQRVFDAALASTVLALRVGDGVIEDLRLTVGATTPRPTVCVTSTAGLIGQPVDAIEPVLVADAAAIEVLGPETSNDPPHLRYQRELIKSVTRRALIRATAIPRS